MCGVNQGIDSLDNVTARVNLAHLMNTEQRQAAKTIGGSQIGQISIVLNAAILCV